MIWFLEKLMGFYFESRFWLLGGSVILFLVLIIRFFKWELFSFFFCLCFMFGILIVFVKFGELVIKINFNKKENKNRMKLMIVVD